MKNSWLDFRCQRNRGKIPAAPDLKRSGLMGMRSVSFRATVTAGAFVLYAASLAMPALTTFEATVPGWFVLVFGFLAVPAGESRWLANPLFGVTLVGILATKRWPNYLAIIPGLAGTLLSASCLWVAPLVATGGSSTPRMHPATLEIGAWCWLLAIAVLFVATLIPIRHSSNSNASTSAAARG